MVADRASVARVLRRARARPAIRNESVFKPARRSLNAVGVRYILAKWLDRARPEVATLAQKRLHPHSIRHSTAVALLKSGVDLSTISQWLGHSCPSTTNRYATIDLEMKRQAIDKVKPIPDSGKAPWRKDQTVL